MKCQSLVVFFLAVAASEALLEGTVTFQLFSKSSPKSAIDLNKDNIGELVDKNAKEIVLFVHGWQDSSKIDWYEDLKNAYFSRTDDYCIIYVDYTAIALLPYPASVAASGDVANAIEELIINLSKNSTDNVLSKINIVGHSLGAQIGGFVGKKIYKELQKKIGKITGLDPAGPEFSGILVGDNGKLIKTDAELVLVIHTDGLGLGFYQPCGTIDVYPNGGTAIQPGCLDILNNKDLINCSHKRSYRFFVEAISIKGSLIATQCKDYNTFKSGKCSGNKEIDIGADLTVADEGVYYLQTNSKSPYGKGSPSDD